VGDGRVVLESSAALQIALGGLPDLGHRNIGKDGSQASRGDGLAREFGDIDTSVRVIVFHDLILIGNDIAKIAARRSGYEICSSVAQKKIPTPCSAIP
jgi:hypothetical protein